MPIYRCGVCNVISHSLDQHATHLGGARHRRNEEAVLSGSITLESSSSKPSKRKRRDAAAVASARAHLDKAEAPLTLRERLLLPRQQNGKQHGELHASSLPTRYEGSLAAYSRLWREALFAEAEACVYNDDNDDGWWRLRLSDTNSEKDRSFTVTSAPAGNEEEEPLCEEGSFLRLRHGGSSTVAMVLTYNDEGGALRLGEDFACGDCEARLVDSVRSLFRADAALLRLSTRPLSRPLLALVNDGVVKEAPAPLPATAVGGCDSWIRETMASSEDWVEVESATNYWWNKATGETSWLRPCDEEALTTIAGEKNALTLVQGPPGTGKTRQLAALIEKLLLNHRVVACAPSNRAVAELASRLQTDCVLLGTRAQRDTAFYCAARTVADRQKASRARLVLCTLATAARSDLHELLKADILVVDEAGQALETELFCALEATLADRCVLCGDPVQLPATAFSVDFARSALERLLPTSAVRFLSVQHRMAPAISAFPNRAFYQGRLRDAPGMKQPDWVSETRLLLDVDGAAERCGTSLINRAEQRCCLEMARTLLLAGLLDLAVISFYKAQVRFLEDHLSPLRAAFPGLRLRVGTVDSFQGSEADAVILSCVRTNGPGFLSDHRRLNVAITRAKHCLLVVCHAQTLEHSTAPHLAALVADARSTAQIRRWAG